MTSPFHPKTPLQLIETLLQSAHSILHDIKPKEQFPPSPTPSPFPTLSPTPTPSKPYHHSSSRRNSIDATPNFDTICSQILFSTPSKSSSSLSPDFLSKLKSIDSKMSYIDTQLQSEPPSFISTLFTSSKHGYNIQSKETKQLIQQAIQYFPKKHLRELFNISTKSIRRWQLKGVDKKKGGRRKMDPIMEEKLIQWYRNECTKGNGVTAEMLKRKARRFCKNDKFKASKGWFHNFKQSYNISLIKKRGSKHIDN